MNFRMERVDLEIKNSLSTIISQMDNKKLANSFVTISGVKTAPDLYSSRISISFLTGTNEENKEILKILNASKGYIKRELASKIKLRRIPDLLFIEDKTEQSAGKVEELLKLISKQDKKD